MILRRALHLKNGVIHSFVKTSSIISSELAIPFRTGHRSLGSLVETASGSRLAGADFESVATTQKALPDVLAGEVDTMNAQKEAELLAMQHVFGLKDASDDAVGIKTKQLQRLQHLKAAEPVFICVDLEAFEFAQDKITEVGVSVLDSRHIIGTDPGPDGKEWLSKIGTRHILIKEHKHLVNKRFVHGCPDKFNFGTSEVVSLKNIHKTLTQLFDNPSPNSIRASDEGSRKIILVGHGLSNDTVYLQKLKFAPNAKGNIIQHVDTQKFVGSKKQQVGLSKLMTGLGIEPENLHNAGNDAAYTMQALLLMTVQHTNDPGAYVKAVADAKAKVDPAKQRYKDHKAAIRAEKLAQEGEGPANVALQRTIRLGQHTARPALPPAAQNHSLLASENINRASLIGSQPQSDAILGSRTSRTHQEPDVPASAISELNKSILSGKTTSDESTTHKISAQSSHQGDEGISPYRTPSLPKHHNHSTHLHSSPTDHTAHTSSSSRKRKGSSTESVSGGHKARSSVNTVNESVEAAQQPTHFKIRTTASRVRHESARHRAAQSHQANSEATKPEVLSESPQFFH